MHRYSWNNCFMICQTNVSIMVQHVRNTSQTKTASIEASTCFSVMVLRNFQWEIDDIYGVHGISVNWNSFPLCESTIMVFAVQYPILWSSIAFEGVNYDLLTRAVPWNTKLKILKFRLRLQGPCVEKRGLSISRYGTSNPVGKHENFLNVHREFVDNFPKNYFHEISPKSFSQAFLLILKFSESCSKTHQGFSEK